MAKSRKKGLARKKARLAQGKHPDKSKMMNPGMLSAEDVDSMTKAERSAFIKRYSTPEQKAQYNKIHGFVSGKSMRIGLERIEDFHDKESVKDILDIYRNYRDNKLDYSVELVISELKTNKKFNDISDISEEAFYQLEGIKTSAVMDMSNKDALLEIADTVGMTELSNWLQDKNWKKVFSNGAQNLALVAMFLPDDEYKKVMYWERATLKHFYISYEKKPIYLKDADTKIDKKTGVSKEYEGDAFNKVWALEDYDPLATKEEKFESVKVENADIQFTKKEIKKIATYNEMMYNDSGFHRGTIVTDLLEDFKDEEFDIFEVTKGIINETMPNEMRRNRETYTEDELSRNAKETLLVIGEFLEDYCTSYDDNN